VSGLPAVRVSDADREQTVGLLREHMVEGRLTLEEFTDRMSAACHARTSAELEELEHDLPRPQGVVPSRRSRTRLLLSVFASASRDGRIRVGRRVGCLMAFGNIDFDLRQATTETDVITIFILGLFGAVDVYVPEGVEVDMHGLAVFGHRRARGNDPLPQPGTPLVRVVALSVFGGVDVWRVPISWSEKTWREVIRGIRAGAHKELKA
jgi:hypothetical protein